MDTLKTFQAEGKYGYEKAKAVHAKRRKAIFDSIKRWVYGSSLLYKHTPEPLEATGSTKGRVVKSKEQARARYGFDDQDRIVYEWSGVETCFTEMLCYHEPGRIVQARYFCTTHEGELCPKFEGAMQLILDAEGRVIEMNNGKITGTRFKWEDGNVTRVDWCMSPGVTEIEYDLAGKVEKVWQGAGKNRVLYFKRPPSGATITSLEPVIVEGLLTSIRKLLLSLKIKEPIYCFALAYDGEGNGVLPPYPGIGLESERAKWLKEHGKEAKHIIWNPAEFQHYEKPHIQIENAKLDKQIEVYNQLLEAKSASDAKPIKLLNDVAHELNKFDWSKHFKVTDDFVVYCVDFELGHLAKNISKTVSAERMKILKQKGFL